MRKTRIILLFAILLGTLAFVQPVSYQPGNFKPGSEPDGFRGIRWGTPISLLDQMVQVWEEGDLRYYEREGDVLEIGGAKLHKIIYVFWNDRFLEARALILKNYDPSLARLSGFGVYFNQNPCNFEARVPEVFTTRAALALGHQPSHGAAADRVTITATALATFRVLARAGCTAT